VSYIFWRCVKSNTALGTKSNFNLSSLLDLTSGNFMILNFLAFEGCLILLVLNFFRNAELEALAWLSGLNDDVWLSRVIFSFPLWRQSS
jgi:hypothetical protein